MPRLSQRLDIRLILVMGVGLALFSTIAGLLTYRYAYRHQLELADTQLQQVVQTVQIQAEIAAFVGNREIAKGVLDGLQANPVILAARIEGNDGFRLGPEAVSGIDFDKARTLVLFSPLGSGEQVGRLVVVRNDAHVEQAAQQTAWYQTSILLMQVLAAVLIIAVLLRIWLINPIVRLAQSMTVIHPGSKERLTIEPSHAGDEIGLLSKSTNLILDAAEVAIDDLYHAKQSLEQALTALEEKERVKSKFFAAASHDLRQPIHAIRLFLEALKNTEQDATQRKLATAIETASQTLNELLESLLDISKLDAGVVVPQLDMLKIEDLFARIDNNFSPLAMKQGLRFKLCFPQRALALHTDKRLLNSVIDNLVGNAFKHTTHGGILVGLRTQGQTCALQVWDTGIGMEPAYLDRIYDEFYQIDNPSRDRRKGLGLGLAIARRVASLLGYELRCRSRPGKGTLFEVRMPLDVLHAIPHEERAPAPADTVDMEIFRGRHVVVLEDDEMVAQGLRDWLTSCGLIVTLCASAELALADPAVPGADCYIVDHQLGGTLTGLDFLQALQLRCAYPLRAVMLSGNTSGEFIAAAAKSDWPLMFKPAEPLQILAKLAPRLLNQG